MTNLFKPSSAPYIIGFVIIFLSAFISPRVHFVFGLISYLVPFALLFLLLKVLHLILFRRNKRWPYVILFVIYAVVFGPRFFQFPWPQSSQPADVAVLNYNLGRLHAVRYHDGHDRLMEFYDFLDLEKPEVLCFQEFYSNRRDDRWNVIKSLGELGYAPVTFHKPGNKYYLESMAIFTTLPQIDTGAIRAHAAGKPLLGVFAQLQHGKDTLTVLNTHIKSFDVKGNNPLAQRSIRGFLHSVKEVLYSLSTTTHTQVYQVEQLTERTAQFDNLVFCGDFNTMPSSYLYSRLKRNFHNAYEENGRYFMFTYLGRTLFFLRIDQQFYRGESFENVSFETLNFHLSDHKALLGRYAFD